MSIQVPFRELVAGLFVTERLGIIFSLPPVSRLRYKFREIVFPFFV